MLIENQNNHYYFLSFFFFFSLARFGQYVLSLKPLITITKPSLGGEYSFIIIS